MPSVSFQPVPKLWPGELVVIAASGPSLTQAQVDAVRGKARLIVINTTYRMAPWADLLYACDGKWWEVEKGAPEFEGLRVRQQFVDADVDVGSVPIWHEIAVVNGVNERGLSFDPSKIHYGSHSGFQALNLAVLLGASRILLIGYDMKLGAGRKRHWHGDHPPTLKQTHAGAYSQWCAQYAATVAPLKARGIEVTNCTPDSALNCFPKADLADCLPADPRPAALSA